MVARAPGFVGFFNPLAQKLLKVGPLLGPNALITVRGRKSGVLRTTPIALVELQGKRWVIGTFGETNWVRNLREAGEATLTMGKRQVEVKAHELSVAEGPDFFRHTLTPYVRHLVIGPFILRMLSAGDIIEDPATAAEHRPVFELQAA
jgi:deazaflavin-dependent oxidoreductase (nitroreductase family)